MRKKKIPNTVLFGAVDFYFCDKADKETLSQYSNVRLFRSQAEYAPEIRRDVVFVGDKCF